MASLPHMSCALALVAQVGIVSVATAVTWHVDPSSAATVRTGLNWNTAYHSYGELLAIEEVQSGDQIWFADFTTLTATLPTGQLELIKGVAYYGGFTGAAGASGNQGDEEDAPSDRPIAAGHTAEVRTILDGTNVVDGRSCVIAECQELVTRFDGFFVTRGGRANFVAAGGGMFLSNTSVHVLNCVFQENEADGDDATAGGAIYVQNRVVAGCGLGGEAERDTRIMNCTFACNTTSFGGWGGALGIDSRARFIHDSDRPAGDPLV